MVNKDPAPKTARQGAVEVLRRAGEPLKSGEIARRVLEVQGVRLAGKTPAATVAAIARPGRLPVPAVISVRRFCLLAAAAPPRSCPRTGRSPKRPARRGRTVARRVAC